MAIEPARLPPFAALRNELARLRTLPLIALTGRAAMVDMLDAYLVSLESRIEALERAQRTPSLVEQEPNG